MTSADTLASALARLTENAARREFFAAHPECLRDEFVEILAASVHQRARESVAEAHTLAEAAVEIAEQLGTKTSRASAFRARGNALYFLGRYRESVESHQQALALFEELDDSEQIGRTLSAAIQPLALTGEYDRAFQYAERARGIFSQTGGDRRLARLENNLGNILHRQDRFAEAVACYGRAYEQLVPHQDYEGMAVTLHNMAVCLISLNDFTRALEVYEQARQLSQQHGMGLLALQADYNIAWLHYLRGDYSRAIELLRAARDAAQQHGDRYHGALCDLDQSEIYLELNLIDEAAEMAQAGFRQFEQLGMGYEAAKCLTNLAVAISRQKNAFRALELFADARQRFVREQNHVWPALIDLYQALVLFHEGRLFEARRLCQAALDFFRTSHLRSKAALSQLLLARLLLRTGDPRQAQEECAGAIAVVSALDSPALSWQAHFQMGQIQEALGDGSAAHVSYQRARHAGELLRSSVRGDELKVAFMKNKLELYERLAHLSLARGGKTAVEEAFDYVEEARARSLRDLLFERAPLTAADPAQSELVRRIRDLREQLNWYYHRIELEQLGQAAATEQRLAHLQELARERESELQRAFLDLGPAGERGLGAAPAVSVEEIRASLGADTSLVEYFAIGDCIHAAVLTADGLDIQPVTIQSRLVNLVRLLQFQMSKFRLTPEYTAVFGEALLLSARSHLANLYDELVRPVRDRLRGSHVVVVPHDVLHCIPFQALFDGSRYLVDTFSVSYAPSAAIFAACQGKDANSDGDALVLGVPDEQMPFIGDEVRAVAAMLPRAQLFIGSEATRHVLEQKGPQSRLIHIATHGRFRQDSPLFSGVRLGDGYLNVHDLYQIRLPAELITLSGCATGLNVVAAGNELLGLVRGLLSAGARSLLLTLWDVQDSSTAEFMRLFYERWAGESNLAAALRSATLSLRERHPHPYFWAPFALVGRPA